MKTKKEFYKALLEILKDLEYFALHLCGNRDYARDLVNDAILEGYKSFKSLNSDKAFLSFMFTILRRKFYNQFNQNKVELIEDADVLLGKEIPADELFDLNLLFAALNRLEPKYKEAFVLNQIIGYNLKETSEIMEISVANTKVRIHRAKTQLKELLDAQDQ
jgi:RNA polymerase sigma-70 factor (ECF subfamily)